MFRTSSYTIYVDLPEDRAEMLLVHGYHRGLRQSVATGGQLPAFTGDPANRPSRSTGNGARYRRCRRIRPIRRRLWWIFSSNAAI